MVKRCAYGLCSSDDRYQDRVIGISFHAFPKPKRNLEKCLRWIKLCNRPHDQLNVKTITKNVFVCSKHFVDGNGPTLLYPDPLPNNEPHFTPKPTRLPPKRRKLEFKSPRSVLTENTDTEKENDCSSSPCTTDTCTTQLASTPSTTTQTESTWIDPLEVMGLSAQHRVLQNEMKVVTEERDCLKDHLKSVSKQCDTLYSKLHSIKCDKQSQTSNRTGLSARDLMTDKAQFKYYTALTCDQFLGIYKFLVPNDEIPFDLPTNRESSIMEIELIDQLFLTVIKLRHNFDYADLAFRFGTCKQTVSIIFSTWINYMYLRFGEVPIWPRREVIKENMPVKYAEEFPTTFAIFDCTEIKICKPSSLKAQSQTYSEYKSTNTLKGLVACDPRGSIIYASMLFSGSISDKDIFNKSGCKKMLGDLVEEGYLHAGDSVMADKGFNVEQELNDCGLKLNIPPFVRQGAQMSESDALLTKKIAAHRVHVERAIARIKRFKILANRLPLSLHSCVNQIWYVSAFLTNFFPPCIQNK